jgi:hypothetical protein
MWQEINESGQDRIAVYIAIESVRPLSQQKAADIVVEIP